MRVGVARLLALTATALLLAAAPAFASLGDEVASGRQAAQRLQAAKTSCDRLSDDDLEHLGEYVMERMLGSRSAHEAMNQRMASMMGSADTQRMHQLIGRRYASCPVSGAGAMMGPGMMSGGRGSWGAMMSSRDFSWMRDGTWRRMTRADWQLVGTAWMAPAMMRNDGWSTAAVVAAVLGALLAVGGVAALTARRPWRRRPPASAA